MLTAAFAATHNGNDGHGTAEAGFATNKHGNNSSIQKTINNHFALQTPWGSDTLATLHVHGNRMSRLPSSDSPSASNPAGGDIYSQYPAYVYSGKDGVPSLYVTDPATNGVSGPFDVDKDCNFSPGFSKEPSESYT
jgi:hypothetical protein